MFVTQEKALAQQSQRIQVEMAEDRNVKIRIENHDDRLGWYTAAALSLPLHQLALLEQAIQDMRTIHAPQANTDSDDSVEGNIIPFPA